VNYEGLLTGAQHCAGYFTTMDPDFIFLWHRRNGHPDCIKIFLFDETTIEEVREAVDEDIKKGGVKWRLSLSGVRGR